MKTLDYLHLNDKKVNNVLNALQALLADFQIYYTNLRSMHWNIKGRGFFTLHEKFESMYNDAAEKIDEIAERILMLGEIPQNKFSEYLKVTRVPEVADVSCGHEAVNNVLDTLRHLIKEERMLIETANEADDVVTADMLTGYIKEQEKMVWMLVAFSTHHFSKPE